MSDKNSGPNIYIGKKGENEGLKKALDNYLMSPEEKLAQGERERANRQAFPKAGKKKNNDIEHG